MKSLITALIVVIFVALAMAATNDPYVEHKPIVVSFPEGTPYSEMDELKAAIVNVVS
jgi:hypothetical protein